MKNKSILLLFIALFVMTGCSSSEYDDMYTFGDTFVFNDMEITFINDIEWISDERINLITRPENPDEYNAFRVPVRITNLRERSHTINSSEYAQFDSNGIQMENISPLFRGDNNISRMPRIRRNVTIYSYMYFLYTGRGNYFVEFRRLFDNYPVEVRLPVR